MKREQYVQITKEALKVEKLAPNFPQEIFESKKKPFFFFHNII